ncbi:cadherin domain-containing protein [Microvirga sp. ACRRW]|uniref:cadherin domain-containing protein n=1 Tax=Microvirga sp. ACRRW TaxID=2918205 RepID=UPI001EF46863|nr:cadherin domain-containing protein [Microvirga sp. ACRRW]MCG7392165.1 cadherin domain-containing protein [Microvirga sp. ACRRW]
MTTTAWGISDFLLNTTTNLTQTTPQVIALNDGSFYAVWADSSALSSANGWDIRGQRFAADGTKLGDELIMSSITTGAQQDPKIALLKDGRFVVAWTDYSGVEDNGAGVRARIFSADGTPTGPDFHVNTVTSNQQLLESVTALADGGFVFTYNSLEGLGDAAFGVLAQAYNKDGVRVGGEFFVNSTSFSVQEKSVVAGLSNGNYAVFFSDYSRSPDDPYLTIRGRIFKPDGEAVTAEFLVPSSRGTKVLPKVAALSDGKFVVIWVHQDTIASDGSGYSIKGQIYNANGSMFGGEFLVNGITNFDQGMPAITALPGGGFAVSYTNYRVSIPENIFTSFGIATFDNNGVRQGSDYEFNLPLGAKPSGNWQSSISVLADGRYILTWSDTGAGRVDGDLGVYGRILEPRDRGVTVNGDNVATSNDEFIGTIYADTLNGKAGNDRLIGDAGDDTLMGGAGEDILDGGIGTDTASYADAGGDVVANLDNPSLNSGDAFNDTYVSIENLTGSSHKDRLSGNGANNVLDGGDDNDTLLGGGGQDTLIGGRGNDELDGGTGADTLSGGAGNDTYFVDDSGDKVVEAIGQGNDIVTASVSYALDATAEVEELYAAAGSTPINLTGSNSANKIYGNGGDNILNGGLGADTLQGYAGDDTYIIDNAGDVIIEAAGADQGFDKVVIGADFQADHTYRLTAFDNVEAIEALNSAGNVNLTGNSGSNFIIGNDGKNILDGGIDTVRDTLQGGKGDDTYIIRDANDIISEAAGEGTDTALILSASYALGKDMSIEVVKADKSGGVSDFTLTGNIHANTIEGADGNDVLDGGGSATDAADKLVGGAGNDTYYIRRSNDLIVEDGGMGAEDKIIASANYVLEDSVHVEIMQAAAGTAKINLTGNAWANKLVGNVGDNILEGGGGNDDIDGGGGFDTVVFTGNRADYVIRRNADHTYTVTDSVAGRDGTDTLRNIKYARFSDGIVDLQAPATVSIVADSATKEEGNGGGWTNYTFTISRTNSYGEATVTWKVVSTGATGASDDDFEFPISDLTNTVTFLEGELTKTVTIRVKADSLDEGHETFNVVLSDLTGAEMGTSTASGVILNDDAPVTMAISATDAAKYEGDTDYTEYTFTVTRSSGRGAASATWNVAGIDDGEGTASADEFEMLAGTVNFAADQTAQTITIRVKGDRQVEANETFAVRLSGATGAVVTTNTAVGVIINDDAIPLVSISATDAVKAEGDDGSFTEYTFTITRSSGEGTSSVRWTVVGTGDHAASLDEFEMTTDSVNFRAGETAKTVTIRVKGDAEIEQNETFAVVLSALSNATIASGSASGTILNDDFENIAPKNIRLTTGGTEAFLDENKTAGSLVATLTADDDGAATALRYYLVTEDDNFEIDELTGHIRVKTGANLNFETVKTYTLTVKVRDLNGTGLEITENITIHLRDVNEAPVLDAAVTAVTVGENAAKDDVVANFTLNDVDADEDFVYEILGLPAAFAGAFAVDTVNKTIVVADRSKLAVNSTQNFTLTLKVTDKSGGPGSFSDTQTFTVTVQDIPPDNRAPENIRLTTDEAEVYISESLSAGQTVAHVMADDDGPDSELRYYLDTNPYFVIDQRSGEIKVKGNARLNYEDLADGKYTVTVRVKDLNGVGKEAVHTIVINVDDENEAATGINFTSLRVVKAGETSKGANVVRAEAVDPDTKAEYRENLYKFANGTNTDGIFTINSITGQITTSRDVTSEDAGAYQLKVVAYDAQNHSLTRTISYTVNVASAGNAAPTLTGVSAPVFAQSNTGTVNPFTNVKLTNEPGETLTVKIKFVDAKGELKGASLGDKTVEGENAVYTISARSADELKAILSGLVFDPRDRSTDAGIENTQFTLTVTDDAHPDPGTAQTGTVTVSAASGENRAPAGLSLSNASVLEYDLPGITIGTLSATDLDGDAPKYRLLDDAGGRFAIVGDKLMLAGVGVNFEEAASHQIIVQAYDDRGGTYDQVFTINVGDQVTMVWRGTKKNDKKSGSALDDILKGGTGNGKDFIKGLDGDDKLYGEGGNDTLYGGNGIDYLSGGHHNDTLKGDAGNDTLKGDNGNDKLYGGAGNDKLYGGKNNDLLKGDAGDDILYGDEGNDKLYGGAGKDTFVFNKKLNAKTNLDTIADFKVVDDTIWLDNAIFKKLGKAGSVNAPAALNKDFFRVGDKAKDKNDYIVYDKKKGILYYDADGSGKGKAVEIAKLSKNLKMTFADFFVV